MLHLSILYAGQTYSTIPAFVLSACLHFQIIDMVLDEVELQKLQILSNKFTHFVDK